MPLRGTRDSANLQHAAGTPTQPQSLFMDFARCIAAFITYHPLTNTRVHQVCDIEPLTWEDRDIVRLEVKQLCDSFEGVCNALRGTDDLLVSGKKCQ